MATDHEAEERRRRLRRQHRQLAAYRNAITDAQLREMNAADAPLTEIPDWAEHQRRLEADAAATVDIL